MIVYEYRDRTKSDTRVAFESKETSVENKKDHLEIYEEGLKYENGKHKTTRINCIDYQSTSY